MHDTDYDTEAIKNTQMNLTKFDENWQN